MTKLKCFAIDDEQDALINLQYLVEEYCSEKASWVGSTTSYEKAITFLNENKIDVLFLDINLGEKSGFDLLQALGHYSHMSVIMVTAYNEYALEAFRHNAINYLLKPVGPDDVSTAIDRIFEREDAMANIVDFHKFIDTIKDRIFVPDRKGWNAILLKNIIYLKGEGSYSHIYSDNEPVQIVSKNLRFFEQALTANKSFIRVQRSFIINLEHVKRVDRQEGGLLEMSNNVKIPISAQQKEAIMLLFGLG